MAKRRARWSSVHRWLGLLLGLWFLLVGATGALLVWRDEVDAALNPSLLRTPARGTPLDLDAVLAAAAELGPVERVRLPQAEGEVVRLQVRVLATRVESGRVEAMVCPVTGRLLGSRSLEALGLGAPLLMRTLYEFHRNVLLGGWGSNIVGIAGFCLLASVLTGLFVAWPRGRAAWRRLLVVNPRASATRISFDLHRSTGVLIGAVLLLSTLTGATLVYLKEVRTMVGWFSRVEPFPVIPWRPAPAGEPITLAGMAARVQAAHPGQRITEVHIPVRAISGVQFHLAAPGDVHRLGDTIAWVHPLSGELLVERSARTRSGGEAFMHWLLPLHVGSAFGLTGLVLMAAAGAAPALLVGTGLWVWWRKRRGERIAAQRAATRRSR